MKTDANLRTRFSYLNHDYHQDVIAAWKNEGCFGKIKRDLGYRFVLRKFSLPKTVRAAQILNLELQMENIGYASMFNARPLYLLLSSPEIQYSIPLVGLGADPRWWQAGALKELKTTIQLPPQMRLGQHKVSLWLPDDSASLRSDPRYSVRIANTGMWDAENGTNNLPEQLLVGP